jgi:deazaflavin-dependent oxidoreductase (nitroreductase family)
MSPISRYLLLLLAAPVALILLVRFFKRPMSAFHRAITNRIARRFAARLPGFAIVRSVGRKSGKVYWTPVNVFRQQNGFLIALTYGRESQWVANVIAAGTCDLESRGITYRLVCPLLVHDRSRQRFPPLVRFVLGLIDANDYLELQLPPHEADVS